MEQWAIVELMGHVKVAGRISEEEKFGAKLGRIDIPKADGFVTQHFGGSSVYRITYCTEEIARLAANDCNPSPVSLWDMRRQLQIEVKDDGEEEESPVYNSAEDLTF